MSVSLKKLALRAIENVVPSAKGMQGKSEESENPGFSVLVLKPGAICMPGAELPVVCTYPESLSFKDSEKVLERMKQTARIVWQTRENHKNGVIHNGIVVVVSGKKPKYDVLIADWTAVAIDAHLRVLVNHHHPGQK